jgi:hypothetical protein
MKMIIGGAVAFLLGVVTIIIFSASFFDLVLGVVPVTLILAGGLMIYLNREALLPKKDQEPPVEEAVIEESVAVASVVEAPAAEEPAVEAPVVEETVTEVSPVEEPLMTEKPVIEVLPAEEPIVEKPVVQESKFVGNTESKIFHTQDCNFAQSKNCTDFFATTEDAVKAGYKPCSRCNP